MSNVAWRRPAGSSSHHLEIAVAQPYKRHERPDWMNGPESHEFSSFDEDRAWEAELEAREWEAQQLIQDGSGRISGVVVRDPDGITRLDAGSVVLACGGFEANPEWRARYLQRPWDMARVRGTAYNTGDGLRMALELGALPFGQWSGNHGTPIDADAPPFE